MTIPDVCHFQQSKLHLQKITGAAAYMMVMRLGSPDDVFVLAWLWQTRDRTKFWCAMIVEELRIAYKIIHLYIKDRGLTW